MDFINYIDAYFTCGFKVFVVVWAIFVPIIITARLEKIIKLLGEKDQK